MSTTAYRRPTSRPSVDLFLDANEGRTPPDPVLRALRALDPERLRRYPEARDLEQDIAARMGIAATRVLVTAGADDGIDRSCRASLRLGGTLLTPRPGFEMFERYGRLAGGRVQEFAWDHGEFPVGTVLEEADRDTAAVAVISPNNPTGLTATTDAVRRLADALPDVLVIVDGAYAEFADEDLTSLALEYENVVALRSFSKAWGLAGARVGYAIGPARWVDQLRAAGPPYAVSGTSLAIAAAALAEGEPAMRSYVDEVRRERNLLVEELTRLGADPLPSEANFVFARFANAARVWEDLQALGIAVRQWPDRAGLSDGLRIGCPGNPDDFSRLVSALRTVLRPEAVLFDMDGVLADESRSYREAIVETARQFGVETSREEIRDLKAAGGANNDWDVTLEIVRRAGVDARRDEVVERFEAAYQGTGSDPGLCELEDLLPARSWLQQLARRYPLGIVTGRPRRDAEAFLRRKDIADLFGVVVTMDDAPVKPDPEPVRLAMRRLGVETAWMIGDTPDDAAAARAAGVLPLGILAPDPDDAVPAEALIERGCTRILPELESLEELLP